MKTLSDILWNGDELVNPQEEGLTEIQFIPINCATPMGFCCGSGNGGGGVPSTVASFERTIITYCKFRMLHIKPIKRRMTFR